MSITINTSTRAVNWETLLSSLGDVQKTDSVDGKQNFTVTTNVDGEAKTLNISVPDDVLQLIAGKIDSNIRELEGCLTRLVAYSTLVKEPITVDLCERALKEIFDSKRHKQITSELIMQTVSDYYGLSMEDMTGPTRKREITVPRQIAMYLTREMTGMSLPQIGNVFGGRDHTTVLHSCKTVEANMTANTDIKAVVEDIKTLVKNAQ